MRIIPLWESKEIKDVNPNSIDSIDFDSLGSMVGDEIGTEVKFDITLDEKRETVDLRSQELVDKCGIMSAAMKSVVIVSNISGFAGENNKQFFVQLSYEFKTKSGGSNGVQLMTFNWVFTDKKWVKRDF